MNNKTQAQVLYNCSSGNCASYPSFPHHISNLGTLPTNCQQELVVAESAHTVSDIEIINQFSFPVTVYLSVDRGNAYESGVQTLDGVYFGTGRDFEIQEKMIRLPPNSTTPITLCIFDDAVVESDEVAFLKMQADIFNGLQDIGNQFKLIIEDNDRLGLYNVLDTSQFATPLTRYYTAVADSSYSDSTFVNDILNLTAVAKPANQNSVIIFPEGNYYMNYIGGNSASQIQPNFTFEAQFYDNADIQYYSSTSNIRVGYNTVIRRSINPKKIPFIAILDTITGDTIKRKPIYEKIFIHNSNILGNSGDWFIFKGLTFDGDLDKMASEAFFDLYDYVSNDFPFITPGNVLFEGCHLINLGFDNAPQSAQFYSYIEDCNLYNNLASGFISNENFDSHVYNTIISNCRKGQVQSSGYNKLTLVNCSFRLLTETQSQAKLHVDYFDQYKAHLGCGLWQEPNAANEQLHVEQCYLDNGSFALNTSEPNSICRVNNVYVDDKGRHNGITFTGYDNSQGDYLSTMLISNSTITHTNSNTVIGTYGNGKNRSQSRIQSYGGITINNTHFILNRYFINTDTNQAAIDNYNRYEPLLQIRTGQVCSRNMTMTLNNCKFTTADSTYGQVNPNVPAPTLSCAFYANNNYIDITNQVIMNNCEIDGFDNCFYAKSQALKDSASIDTCMAFVTPPPLSAFVYYHALNTLPDYNGYRLAGNNFIVNNSSFINSSGFLNISGTNKFVFNYCFMDNMPNYYLQMYVPFNATTSGTNPGLPISPFPSLAFINCVSRQVENNDNSISIRTVSSTIGSAILNTYMSKCILSSRAIYTNKISSFALPEFTFTNDKVLGYQNGPFQVWQGILPGYNYRHSLASSFIMANNVYLPFSLNYSPNDIGLLANEITLTESNRYDYCRTSTTGYSLTSHNWVANKNNNYPYPLHLSFSNTATRQHDYIMQPQWKVVDPNYLTTTQQVPTHLAIQTVFDNIDAYSNPIKEYDEAATIAIIPHTELYNTINANNKITTTIQEYDLSSNVCRDQFPYHPDQLPTDCTPPPLEKQIPIANTILAYPNPANQATTISFTLQQPAASASISIINLQGHIKYTQALGYVDTQPQTISIPTHRLPSGSYLLRVVAGNNILPITKLTIIKD